MPTDPDNSFWPPPFLLYLGNAPDELSGKTARGLAAFRPQWCVGQFRGPECKISLDLQDMDFTQARAAGANTMIVGVANAGGQIDPATVAPVVAALDRSEGHTSSLTSPMRTP